MQLNCVMSCCVLCWYLLIKCFLFYMRFYAKLTRWHETTAFKKLKTKVISESYEKMIFKESERKRNKMSSMDSQNLCVPKTHELIRLHDCLVDSSVFAFSSFNFFFRPFYFFCHVFLPYGFKMFLLFVLSRNIHEHCICSFQ